MFSPASPPEISSPLGRLDPRAKLVTSVVCAGIVAAMSQVVIAGLAFAIAVMLVLTARLPGRWLARRAAVLAIAVAPFAVLMPILQGWDGARLAALVTLKAFAIASLMLVAVATATLPATARAAAALGVPKRIVEIGLLSYRYLFVLGDEFGRLRTAMRVRGFRAGTNGHSYRTAGHALGVLFIRGAARAERISQALRCRGSTGRFRVLDRQRFELRDAAFMCSAVAVFALLLVFDRWSS